jgi:glycosyltransferase involved in cell wall biosynthesis
MRIIFFNSNSNWGGGEKWHLETALALKMKGYEVYIVAAPGKNLLIKARQAGLDVYGIKIGNISFLNPLKIIKLYHLFKQFKPDVLLLSLPSDIKAAATASASAGIKRIIYRRGLARPVRNSFFNRFLFRKVITDVIANSEETRRTILENNSKMFDFSRINVIYNGIDLDHYDNIQAPGMLKKEDGCIFIGAAGRLEEQKNHRALVYVAKKLTERGLNFRIFIAGTGSLENDILQLARKEGVSDRLILTGFADPLKAFLQCLDIFVLPSFFEGFGFVIIEAMACSRPVVAFNASSNPEVITDQETGFLAEPGNIDDLAGKIIMLAKDEAMRKEMGMKGRLSVEQNFSMKAGIEKLEKMLAQKNKIRSDFSEVKE